MTKYIVALFSIWMIIGSAQEYPDIGNVSNAVAVPNTMSERDKPLLSPVKNEPVWQILVRMSSEERANSKIELELETGATSQAIQMADIITDLWNRGEFEDALALFPELAKLTDPSKMAIGNSWRTPVPTKIEGRWGNDVRIGNRDSISVVCLDIHRASGNLFAVLLNQEGTDYYWSVNLSTDGGETWNETYDWYASYRLTIVAASVVANHCYVGYGSGHNLEARLRRLKTTDATPDTFPDGSDYITVFTTTSPDSLKEVASFSNQDYLNNRLYYVAITTEGNLRYFWNEPTGVIWHEITTGVDYADRGLDAHYNDAYSWRYAWMSYISKNDSLHVDVINDADAWEEVITRWAGNNSLLTSVGAYHDTIIVVYEHQGPLATFCRYRASYDGGNSWSYGSVDGDTTHYAYAPDVASRYDGGQGIAYAYESPRQGRYVWRNYSGSWTTPVFYSWHQPTDAYKPAIEYLGSSVYGTAYISNAPLPFVAYFTRSDWLGVEEGTPRDFNAYLVSLVPNPSNGIAKLSYAVKKTGHVKISVYDINGRLISNVINTTIPAGTHSLNLNNQNLASGIYFVRVETPDGTATKTMTIVR